MNVKLENMSNKKNGFTQHLYNPIVWVIVGTALLGLHAFFVQNMYIQPAKAEVEQKIHSCQLAFNKRLSKVEYVADTNSNKLQEHQSWCEKTLSKELDNRPTSKELSPKLEAIEKNIESLKKALDTSMQLIIQKLK